MRKSWRGIVSVLVCLAGLHAQPNCVPFLGARTNSGTSLTVANYDPFSPVAKAPAAAVAPPSSSPGAMPTVSPSEYAAYKSALAPYAKSSFPFPPRVDVNPSIVAPKAPAAPTPVAQGATFSWPGIQDTQNGGSSPPPSPDIAVGPSDVLMAVNSSIALFTRSGTLVKLTAFTDWFAAVAATICPEGAGNCQIYDPVLRYDQLHGRFLFLASSRTIPDQRFGFTMLSVSNGPTFGSGWKIWVFNPVTDGTSATFGDFWKLSYDNSAVYLAGNLFSPLSLQYAKIRVLKKSELYNPSATSLNFADIWNLQNSDSKMASSLDPVQQRGMPSAVNTGGLFVNASASAPAAFLTVWKLTDPLAATLSLTRCTVTGLLPYYYPQDATQLGGGRQIQTGDSRILKSVYRNGSLYTTRGAGTLMPRLP
jgi:hypothetical protein